MKKKNYQLSTLLALFFVSTNLFAFNYTITFTGSGASTSVESVIVQNLTKKTNVTVPLGNVLNLTDVTAINEVNYDNQNLRIFSDGTEGKITIAFLLNQSCNTQINVYGLDGKKVVGSSMNLSQGENSFNLSLPKGVYTIQVLGNGFLYKTKFINEVTSTNKPQITFVESKNPTFQKVQKNISGVTTMFYNTGDQLLYKGISGNYSTIVTDKPINSKTTNFNFVECKDGDGNYYPVVKIGTQLWMAENLKTTKYNDGLNIPLITDIATWTSLSTSGYCWFNNSIGLKDTYGALYNWFTVNAGKFAPTGWHVPTDAEWTTLTDYLGSESEAGGKLKETGIVHWTTPNTGSTNETGFSALPAAGRGGEDGVFGGYGGLGGNGGWWSSTDNYPYPWYRSMYFDKTLIFRDKNSKTTGYSVRCVKD